MKILTAFLIFLFLGKGCDNATAQDMGNTVIEYTASSRGFYQKITVKNETLTVSRNRNVDDKAIISKINPSNWKSVVLLFQELKLEDLKELKAPSEKRFYDGAAIASLKISIKDKNYETSSFDHGFPPKEIKQLVDKINSLVKKD
ncbi:hypothetical protein SAMN05444396_103252 [Flavobacterium segetis]|uniref:Lipoprotein n=1 Tax=Flavobacterium segetis TaxID=271157 RepID=A0A1M5G3U4_9FLAO|nr:hypothetical protein [Flavobacterium segetis]SHF98398.1 hypothetical protein SAMN05444396_103252 [Flavobacterium segetis]